MYWTCVLECLHPQSLLWADENRWVRTQGHFQLPSEFQACLAYITRYFKYISNRKNKNTPKARRCQILTIYRLFAMGNSLLSIAFKVIFFMGFVLFCLPKSYHFFLVTYFKFLKVNISYIRFIVFFFVWLNQSIQGI